MKIKQALLIILVASLSLNSTAQFPLRMGFEGFDSSYAFNEFLLQNLSVYTPQYNNFFNSYAQRNKLKAIIEINKVKYNDEDKKDNPKDKSWRKTIWLYKNGWLTDGIAIENWSPLTKTGKTKYRTDTMSWIHYEYYNDNQKIFSTYFIYRNRSETSIYNSGDKSDSFNQYYFNKHNRLDSIIKKESKIVLLHNDSNITKEINFYKLEQLNRKLTFTYKNENAVWLSAYENLKKYGKSYPEMNFLNTELSSEPHHFRSINIADDEYSNSGKPKEHILHSWTSEGFTFLFLQKEEHEHHIFEIGSYSVIFKSKNGVISNFTKFRDSKDGYELENYQLKGDTFEHLKVDIWYTFINSVNRSKFAKDLRKRIYFGHSKKNGFYYKLIR